MMRGLKFWACLAAVLAFAAPVFAQTNYIGNQGFTSGNTSRIGIPDTTSTYQENLPSSAGTTGQIKKNTGSNNTAWVNQSSLGWVYLACNPTPTFGLINTGTTETALAQCEIPSGFMSANSAVKVTAFATRSATANSDVFHWRIGTAGTTSDTQCGTNVIASAAVNVTVGGSIYFINEASTSINSCMNVQPLLTNNNTNFPALAIATASNPVFITLFGTPGVSGDVLTGVWAVGEYLPSVGAQ